ncbi:hypothetical protein Bca4012_065459 [Brassica carinata]
MIQASIHRNCLIPFDRFFASRPSHTHWILFFSPNFLDSSFFLITMELPPRIFKAGEEPVGLNVRLCMNGYVFSDLYPDM